MLQVCKALIAPVLLLCLVLMLACPEAVGAEDMVVSFCYWANFRDHNMYSRICDMFEEQNPGITIKQEWVVGDYGRKLQLQVITEKAADIILMDDEIFPTYGVRGYLEDLRPYVERESDDLERSLAADMRYLNTPEDQRDPNYQRAYLPTSLESFNYRGFQGGLPWDGNAVMIFYNKDLFDDAGISYPSEDWTWDEFRIIAKKLTKDLDGDGRPDQFGTNIGFGFLGFEPVLWCFGGEVLNEDKTKCAMHGSRAIEAANLLFDMKYIDHSIAWTGEMEGIGTEVQLLTGRLGMVPAGSYMIPMLNLVGEEAMRWGLAHMPIGPYGDRYTRVTWDGISINAHTTPEKKEIAWRFIKHFLSPDVQRIFGGSQRGMPIRREDVLASYIKPETPANEEAALEATAYAKLTPITPRYLELRDAMKNEFDRLNIAHVYNKGIDDPADWVLTPTTEFPKLEEKVNIVLEKELADWAEAAEGGAGGSASTAGTGLKALGCALLIVVAAFVILMLFPPVRRGLRLQVADTWDMLHSRMGRKDALEGLLFASPWLMGLLLFTAFPIVFSIVLSFSEWDPYMPITEMKFIGLRNFMRAFSTDPVHGDPLVLKALYNTFYFAFFAVPLGLCTSLGLAILLNQKVRGITIFRTTFYLPSIIAGVATVILWSYIFNPVFGPLNNAIRHINQFFDWTHVLAWVNLPEPYWLGDPRWTKRSLILMSLWRAGGSGMLIFLAGLQGVPDQLYEVADLDGAGRLRKFWNITVPMLTPTIYFNLIMGIIGALKVFMQAYILTEGGGGADNSLRFYVLHLFVKAFVEFEMGYASALAWILFVIIMAFTMMVIKSSAVWVYYEGEKRGR